MRHKASLVFSCVTILLIFLVGSIGGADSEPQNQDLALDQLPHFADSELQSAAGAILSPKNRLVPDPVEAFNQLTAGAEWMGFYPNWAPYAKTICLCFELEGQPMPIDECMPNCSYDPGNCCPTRAQHYQGITRHPRTGKPPIFYVTRAGQPGSALHDTEGALWVVQMESDWSPTFNGERLGSNRLKFDTETKDTMSNLSSLMIYMISFDQDYQGGVLDYNHPGGVQAIGNILAVALEGPNSGVLPVGKIAFFDTSFPEQPMYLGIGKDIYLDHKAAAVGIAWHPTYQRYFVVIGSGGSKNTIEIYKSNGDNFNDPGFQFEHFDTIARAELQALADNGDYQFEPEPQSLSLIVGQNKRMYLIGAANSDKAAPIVNGQNRMWLWEMKFPESSREKVTLVPKAKADKNLHSYGDPNLGPCSFIYNNLQKQEANFSAGAGAYVSPTGELLYYATSFWNFGMGGTTRMAELRSKYVSHKKSCGPQFLDDHLGGPYRIPEKSELWLDGEVHVIYPWVHMYDDPNFGDSNNVMMDWSGQFHDDYDYFSRLDGEGGFKDDMSSFRFCGPVGAKLEIFDARPPDDKPYDERWEEAKNGNDGWIQCDGTGEVIEVPNLSTLGDHCRHLDSRDSDDFDGDADSARLLFSTNAAYEWELTGDAGGHVEKFTHDEAIFHAPSGNSNHTVWLDVLGKKVKTDIEVYNVPPEVTSIEVDRDEIDEGQKVTLTAGWSDPGAPQVTARVYWGDGTDDEKPAECSDCLGPYSGSIQFSHTYADNGDYEVKACFDDDLEDEIEEVCGLLNVKVNNTLPELVAGEDQLIYEGDVLLLDPAAFKDAGFDCSDCDPESFEDFSATVDWGDGTSEPETDITIAETAGSEGIETTGTIAASFAYGDNSVYTVEVCVTDDDGGKGCDDLAVTVKNIDPTVVLDKGAAISFNGGLAFLARRGVEQTFNSDAADIGTDDLIFNWSFPPSTVLDSTATYFNDFTNPDPTHSPHGNRPFERSDTNKTTFSVTGVYEATIDIYDDDGGHVMDSLPLLMTDSRGCTATRSTWGHQYGVGGKQTIDALRLQGYLDLIRIASAYFDDGNLETLADAQAIFSAKGSSDANHLKQHALAAWLNFASGGVLWDQQIRHLEGPFHEEIGDIDAVLLNPDAAKKDIVDAQQDAIRINTNSPSNSSCNDAGTP